MKTLTRLAAYSSAALLAAGSIGQVTRDRSVPLALLMYIPLLPLGAVAVAADLAFRGRSLPRLRFGLTVVGLVAMAWSAHEMIGEGHASEPAPGDLEVSVLHWNVQWGGGPFRGPRTWAAQRAGDSGQEARPRGPQRGTARRLARSARRRPGSRSIPRRNVTTTRGAPTGIEWRRALDGRSDSRSAITFPGGSGMSVLVEINGRPLRLLVVDGLSSPFRPRVPFLQAIANACREAEASGKPYDLVLGDFNTPSRSRGFADLEALGYRLAGRETRGWRGTFPSWLPVYDIDHVWMARHLSLGSCTFFNGPHTDHRGQIVRVLLPKEDPP